MICPNCKNQIDDDSNFCKYCGSKVVVANKCPHCGATPLPKDAKFCPDCGKELTEKNSYEPKTVIARHVSDINNPLSFADNCVLPNWPQRGKELSTSCRNNLMEARKLISEILKQNITHKYASYYKFIDTCIKAIIDISEGWDPYFHGYILASSDQRNFWENMKARFGEKNYNKYFHYHSGDLAEELRNAITHLVSI